MTDQLLYYSIFPILHSKNPLFNDIPGIDNFKTLAGSFDSNLFLHDRSGVIEFPFAVKSYNPLPEFNPNFNLSFRECAAEQMKTLDKLHQATGKKFRLFYSGGVDSSGIFAAFIDYYGASKASEILEICCSKESIDENPWLWDNFIRKENFDIISSYDHSYYWNDNRITVMGEGADQLFGKTEYLKYKGSQDPYSEINLKEVSSYLHYKNPKGSDLVKVSELLIKVGEQAPMPITNMALLVWWYEIVFTWDALMLRVLNLAKDLPKDVLASGLVQFYNTKEFQQWSFKLHYDFPTSFMGVDKFKPHIKEMVIDILDIPEYASKSKMLSFPRLHGLRPAYKLIDTDLNRSKKDEDYFRFIQPNSFE